MNGFVPKPGGKGGGEDGDHAIRPGLGWVVVAFVSPVTMDVAQLAAQMLSGSTGKSFQTLAQMRKPSEAAESPKKDTE